MCGINQWAQDGLRSGFFPEAVGYFMERFKGGRMASEAVRERGKSLVEHGMGGDEAVTAVSHAREAVNLRLLLELRRRLKAAAERELAMGADRMRRLRSDLRRGEAELRLFGNSLRSRGQELGRMLARVQSTEARAAQTCERLCALEREHEDLAQQLGAAEQEAASLRRSVQSARQVRHGTLDSLVLATEALTNDLDYAVRDQGRLRARGRDLMEEGKALAARAGALHTCFSSLARTVGELTDRLDGTLDGLPRPRREAPVKLERPEGRDTRVAS